MDKLKYISYVMDGELHQRMKEHCIKNQISIREYLTKLIEKDLKKGK